MATRKITISVEARELAWVEAHARRAHGGNVSAAFLDGVHALRRREALGDFLRLSGAPMLTPDEVTAVLAEIRGAEAKPKRRRRAGRAA